MPISWNEIRQNAIQFSREWAGAKSESAEKQTFWNEFFGVFGMKRRTLAGYKRAVRNFTAEHDKVDLFWPYMMIVEHREQESSFDYGDSQSYRCVIELINSYRQDDVPRFVLLTDFARISLLDLEPDDPIKRAVLGGYRMEFPVSEFPSHVKEFAFIAGLAIPVGQYANIDRANHSND
jgi:hypothetical protein